MKKNYELPVWEIILFDEEDVITESISGGAGGDDLGDIWDDLE